MKKSYFPQSIRWRLPLSYAGIALFTTLALGGVLLMTLRDYYTQQERAYLDRNVEVIATNLEQMYRQDVPLEAIEAQLQSYAFMSRANVSLLDDQQQVLREARFSFGGERVTFSVKPFEAERFGDVAVSVPLAPPMPPSDITYISVISLQPDRIFDRERGAAFGGSPSVEWSFALNDICFANGNRFFMNILKWNKRYRAFCQQNAFSLFGSSDEHVFSLPVGNSFYGYDLSPRFREPGRFSDQRTIHALYGPRGNVLGYVQLSEGPAYGTEIVDSVARALFAASGIAVLLAAIAGWFVSRQITKPLLALTATTQEMSTGQLSARVPLQRRDEFGVLADSFNEMAQRVENTVVTLRRFVADAAHELHTPLTALRTNLELAQPSDYIEQAYGQVVRLQNLTTNLLDLARIEANPSKENLTPIDVGDFLTQMAILYASRIEQAGLNLNLSLPAELLLIEFNTAHLTRAVDNLLDNALKFTLEKGTITLGAYWRDGSVIIWVEDTGIGIPAEEVPNLFNRFHRARNAAAYTGNGLGLVITKSLLENHGGQISVDSSPEGTRFEVLLPVKGKAHEARNSAD